MNQEAKRGRHDAGQRDDAQLRRQGWFSEKFLMERGVDDVQVNLRPRHGALRVNERRIMFVVENFRRRADEDDLVPEKFSIGIIGCPKFR